MLDQLFDVVDVSFKWILLGFNFITIIFVYFIKNKNKKIKQHHILFLIAHPDDQSMFFVPTITNLQDVYFIHVLCLSGKGTIRQTQLQNACKVLKVDHITCISDDKLVDGMKQKWSEQTIRKYVFDYVNSNNIKAIFTFDNNGVSNHINHIALYNALKQKQTQQKQNQKQKQKPEGVIKIYYLQSVSLVRKYMGLLDMPAALLKTFSWIQFTPFTGYAAMKQHQSQFVWYRRLWVFFSRYQYINTYKRALLKVKQKEQ